MNIFGIGPLELLLVIILALIFLGPEELPTIARKLGKLMRDLQALSAEFTEQVRAELGPELEELNRATRELQEVGKQAQEIRSAVQNPTRAVERHVREALSPTTSTKEKPAAEEAETTPAPLPQTSLRPLTPPADTTQQEAEG